MGSDATYCTVIARAFPSSPSGLLSGDDEGPFTPLTTTNQSIAGESDIGFNNWDPHRQLNPTPVRPYYLAHGPGRVVELENDGDTIDPMQIDFTAPTITNQPIANESDFGFNNWSSHRQAYDPGASTARTSTNQPDSGGLQFKWDSECDDDAHPPPAPAYSMPHGHGHIEPLDHGDTTNGDRGFNEAYANRLEFGPPKTQQGDVDWLHSLQRSGNLYFFPAWDDEYYVRDSRIKGGRVIVITKQLLETVQGGQGTTLAAGPSGEHITPNGTSSAG